MVGFNGKSPFYPAELDRPRRMVVIAEADKRQLALHAAAQRLERQKHGLLYLLPFRVFDKQKDIDFVGRVLNDPVLLHNRGGCNDDARKEIGK
jgi:hypothetical protein